MNNLDFVSVLSSALTPVTLISGVGLLMLTMSARYAHTTNRIRELLKTRLQLLTAGQLTKDDLKLIDEEILLIFHRSKLLKRAILFVVMSAAFSGLLVLTSVIATVFGLNEAWRRPFFVHGRRIHRNFYRSFFNGSQHFTAGARYDGTADVGRRFA